MERGLRLSDGDIAVFALMVRASGVTVAAYGAAAYRLHQRGLPPDLVPLEPTPEGLADALSRLDLVAGKSVAVVGVARSEECSGGAGGGAGSADLRLAQALAAAGGDVTVASACIVRGSGGGSGSLELELLLGQRVDALCLGSEEEAYALAALLREEVPLVRTDTCI